MLAEAETVELPQLQQYMIPSAPLPVFSSWTIPFEEI